MRDESGPFLVDPFHAGRLLSDEEAFGLVESVLGTAIPRAPVYLRAIDHGAWIERLLRNLEGVYRRRAQPRDAECMRELRAVLTWRRRAPESEERD